MSLALLPLREKGGDEGCARAAGVEEACFVESEGAFGANPPSQPSPAREERAWCRGSGADSRSNTHAASRADSEGNARGATPCTASAIALMCSGVVPQQPPTRFTSPERA